jgi:hypothetical protein
MNFFSNITGTGFESRHQSDSCNIQRFSLLKQNRATLKKEAKYTPLQVNTGEYFVRLQTKIHVL